jgi:hypothetical protein
MISASQECIVRSVFIRPFQPVDADDVPHAPEPGFVRAYMSAHR